MSNVRRRTHRVELHMKTKEQDPHSPVCALRQRLGLLRWPTALREPKNHSAAPHAFLEPVVRLEALHSVRLVSVYGFPMHCSEQAARPASLAGCSPVAAAGKNQSRPLWLPRLTLVGQNSTQ